MTLRRSGTSKIIKNANTAWGENVEKPVDMYMKDTRKLKRKCYLKVTGK